MSEQLKLSQDRPLSFTARERALPRRNGKLSLRVGERRMLLMLTDLGLMGSALIAMTRLPLAWAVPLEPSLGDYILWLSTLCITWLAFAQLFDIYNLERAARPLESVWAASGVVVLTVAAQYLIPLLTPGIPARRLHVFVLPALALATVIPWRLLYARIFAQASFSRRALLVGAGHAAQGLLASIPRTPQTAETRNGHGYHLLGFVDDEPAKIGQTVDGVPVLGASRDLVQLAHDLHAEELIVAITNAHAIGDDLFRAILTLREQGLPVTTLLDLYEQTTGRVPVAFAGRNLHIVLPTKQPGGLRFYLFLRRLFDVAVSLVGCLFLLLLTPFVWLGNRLTAPGDLFYRQERVGEAGRPFFVYKFRSMVMDAEKFSGAVWADENDPRITPVGRFLRKTRLDEVPQFWNVLRGDMSFIGPRPERPVFVQQLCGQIPFYNIRHAVRPGITGWAQVGYRYGASVEDALVKLEYDLYYIKHQNPYLDFQILVKTVQVILGLQGR